MPKARLPELQRFMSFVEIPKESGCWLWMAQTDKWGYGHFKSELRDWLAHRWSYKYFRKRLNPHLTLDHLCRRTACVNPFHLEQVTNKENILRGNGITANQARQTHCKNNHLFDDKNTYLHKGMRHCKKCNSERSNSYKRSRS